MKRLLTLFFLVFTLYSSGFAQDDSLLNRKVALLIDSVKSDYRMDRRTTVFNLTIDSSGAYVLEHTHSKAANDFLNRYKAEGINTPLYLVNLPDSQLGDKLYALVTLSVGNIRSEPRNSAEMATQALLGWQVDILKQKGGYYLVRTPDGYIGWLDAAAISLKDKQEIDEWNRGERVIFTDDYGHAYEDANKQATRVSDLVMGDILKVLAQSSDFLKVLFPDGRTAYVATSQTKAFNQWKEDAHPTSENILRVAKRMIGVPYLWGGTSIKGVDCSGFTKTAFFMNGIIIPRDASQQVLVGKPIAILTNNELDTAKAIANLQPGDLLFFAGGKHKSPEARITHVALYMGKGQFIQSAGKVRINSMLPNAPNYDDFQTRTVVAARRYLGYIGTEGIKKVE